VTLQVVLKPVQVEQAAYAGIKRRLLALYDGRPAYHGFKEADAWGSDIESAAAELAVAVTLGLYWTPWARRPGEVPADVGRNVQVRRRSQPDWDLLAQPSDPPGHYLVLVTGAIPAFDLRGWIPVNDALDPRYWGDPYHTQRPAYWIPQSHLNQDIASLRQWT